MCCWSPLSWHCPINNTKFPRSHSWSVMVSSDTVILRVTQTCVFPMCSTLRLSVATTVCHFTDSQRRPNSVAVCRWLTLFQVTQGGTERSEERGSPIRSCTRTIEMSPTLWSMSVGHWVPSVERSSCSSSQPHLFFPSMNNTISPASFVPSLLTSLFKLWISTETWTCMSDFLSLWKLTIYCKSFSHILIHAGIFSLIPFSLISWLLSLLKSLWQKSVESHSEISAKYISPVLLPQVLADTLGKFHYRVDKVRLLFAKAMLTKPVFNLP